MLHLHKWTKWHDAVADLLLLGRNVGPVDCQVRWCTKCSKRQQRRV